jgi:hypothetical protein
MYSCTKHLNIKPQGSEEILDYFLHDTSAKSLEFPQGEQLADTAHVGSRKLY